MRLPFLLCGLLISASVAAQPEPAPTLQLPDEVPAQSARLVLSRSPDAPVTSNGPETLSCRLASRRLSRPSRTVSRVGQSLPAHATALGKAALSTLAEADVIASVEPFADARELAACATTTPVRSTISIPHSSPP